MNAVAKTNWFCCLVLLTQASAQTNGPATVAGIEGRVIAAATGEPVRKAEVSLLVSQSGDDAPELVATTDDSASFDSQISSRDVTS